MYPLRYRIIAGLVLSVLSVMIAVLALFCFLRGGDDSSFIDKYLPYTFLLCAVAIIISPVIIGSYGHCLAFFISVPLIYILSLITGRYLYNLQSLILLAACINVNIFYRKNERTLERKDIATQKVKEATNILKSQRIKTEELNTALSERLRRYHNLREIGESFSAKLSLEEVSQLAVDTAYSLMPEPDTALLFIVDEKNQRLLLTASKVQTGLPRVKAKKGDIFDHWVFKERQPLNVSDINQDYRFDYKPLPGERPFASLISAPIVSQSRITGILRLNSRQKGAYSFDDLRLLDFISDMASSAINNARLYKTTEELSTKDSLTGFYIHRYLKQRLEEETERARITGSSLSIIMIDIDHFKDYNDRYGHLAGDKVLIRISKIIQNNMKDGYIAARYGGEEFVIILPDTDERGAKALAEKIREDILSYPFMLRREETRVTVSGGVASYTKDIKDREELLKKADFYLYKAKKEGRNRICVA